MFKRSEYDPDIHVALTKDEVAIAVYLLSSLDPEDYEEARVKALLMKARAAEEEDKHLWMPWRL